MCGGKKSAAPAPAPAPAPPAKPGYGVDQDGVVRNAATMSPEGQQASFGSELGGQN